MGNQDPELKRAQHLLDEATREDCDFSLAVFTADCNCLGGFYWFQDWKHLAYWMRDLAVVIQDDADHELDPACLQRVEIAALDGDARKNPRLEDDLEAILGFWDLADNGVRIDVVDEVLNQRGEQYTDARETFYFDLPELDEDAIQLVRGLKFDEDECEVDTSKVDLTRPVPASLHDLYRHWVRTYSDLHS